MSLDAAVLSRLGFGIHGEVGKLSLLDADELQTLAEVVFSLIYRILARRLLSYMSYSHSLPMKLFALVDERADRVTAALAEHLESEASKGDDHCEHLLEELVWTTWDWPRRVLVILAEADFECVPPELHEELLMTSRVPPGTEQTEDGIKEIRRASDVSMNRELSHDGTWAALLASSVLREVDVAPVQESETSLHAAQGLRVNAGIYNGKREAAERGIPDQFLQKLTSKRTPWRSPNASYFDSMPLTWSSAVECYSNSIGMPKMCFSSMAVVGCILQNRKREMNGLCIHASAQGVIIWRLRLEIVGTRRLYSLRCAGEGKHWVSLVIDDWKDWQGCACKMVLPTTALAIDPSSAELRSLKLRLERVGDVADLFHLSASHGFKGCTVPQLKQLWAHWHAHQEISEVPKPPFAEQDLVHEFCKKVLGASVSLESVWSQRSSHMAHRLPVVLTPAAVSKISEAFDEEDVVDIAAGVQEDLATLARKAKHAQSARVSTSASSASSSARRPLPLSARKACYTVQAVKKLCPASLKIIISKETSWDKRWRAHCPDMEPPNRYNGMFATGEQEFRVVCALVRWAWQMSGQACPYEFAE